MILSDTDTSYEQFYYFWYNEWNLSPGSLCFYLCGPDVFDTNCPCTLLCFLEVHIWLRGSHFVYTEYWYNSPAAAAIKYIFLRKHQMTKHDIFMVGLLH